MSNRKNENEIDEELFNEALGYGWAVKPLETKDGIVTRFKDHNKPGEPYDQEDNEYWRVDRLNEILIDYLSEKKANGILSQLKQGDVVEKLVAEFVAETDMSRPAMFNFVGSHIHIVNSEYSGDDEWMRMKDVQQKIQEVKRRTEEDAWDRGFDKGFDKGRERGGETDNVTNKLLDELDGDTTLDDW